MKRKIMVGILTILLVLGLCGCISVPDDESIRSSTEQMITAISQGDVDGGYALIRNACTEAEFRTFYRQVAAELGALGEYTLKPVGINQKTSNGITQTMITYRLDAENGVFLVQVVERSDIDGLAGFHVEKEEPVTSTGTLTSMGGADVLQWLVLIVGLTGWAFVIWMMVDCARKPIPKKWLCQFLVTLQLSPGYAGVRFNLGIYLTSTALIRSSTGETMLQIVIPLGAAIYFSQRGKLVKPEPQPEILPEQVPETEQE